MTITVHLFAAARDLAGTATVEVVLPPGGTALDVRRSLALAHPQLAGLLNRSRIAVDHDFADDATTIRPGAEVAVIPPVSGG